jgi:hypothetical protein
MERRPQEKKKKKKGRRRRCDISIPSKRIGWEFKKQNLQPLLCKILPRFGLKTYIYE